jgi:hypothetical protein
MIIQDRCLISFVISRILISTRSPRSRVPGDQKLHNGLIGDDAVDHHQNARGIIAGIVPAHATVPNASRRSTPMRNISGMVTLPTIAHAARPEPDAAPNAAAMPFLEHQGDWND